MKKAALTILILAAFDYLYCANFKDMGKIVIHDLIGKTFKSYKVIAYSHYNHEEKKHFWLVKCIICGKDKRVRQAGLLYKNKGCKCVNGKKHGLHKSPEYQAYLGMRQRCYNKKAISYNNYGGRGITVCERWLDSFQNFYDDMGPRPSGQYSLDRIDVNQNYSPENCKWSTLEEQANNKRDSVHYVYNGESLSIRQIARKFNLKVTTLQGRIESGWSISEAIEVPVVKYQKYKQKRNEKVANSSVTTA